MNENKNSHSILSPSGATKWFHCPASLYVCKDAPKESNEYADEGTKAHELASMIFSYGKIENEENYDKEMINHIKNYVESIYNISQGACVSGYEIETDLSSFYNIEGEKGTIDFTAVVPIEPRSSDYEIQIHDLKYGMGKVESKDNLQLLIYAIGVYEKFSIVYNITHIHLYIHQPRINNFSDQRYTIEEVLVWGEKIKKQGNLAYDLFVKKYPVSEEHFIPGEKQCKFCDYAPRCKVFADFVKDKVFTDFDELDEEKNKNDLKKTTIEIKNSKSSLSISNISENMKFVSLIRLWCDAIENYITQELVEGREIPGWKLIKGRAKPGRWSGIEFLNQYIIDKRLTKIMIEKKIISPAQAKKVLPEKKWNDISKWVEYSEPNPMLVTENTNGAPWVSKSTEEMKVIEQKGGDTFIEDSFIEDSLY